MAAWGLTVLRIAVALSFVVHGFPKLASMIGGSGIDPAGIAQSAAGAGWLYTMMAVVETLGGLALLAGGFTVWVSLALIVDALIAIWRVRMPSGSIAVLTTGPGVDLYGILIAALVCLMLTGAGALSLDERRARSEEAAALGRARLRSKSH